MLIKILSFDQNAFAVMLSGNSNEENIIHAMMLGAKGFVGKPFSKDKLSYYIQKCKHNNSMKAMA
ncbi:MAG: hypothetical protein DI551_09445 [Micavibrio aeruginosavorus]|uniref:Response regulatory domain-containing protein n=1 Tax=Micavibrio aeruginosavorus TaxID=349221 RepID=A0A2W5MUE4_9BACT|nr:MAG: hypothetical protein DI551_09445 [Micavibrio aeruginosavorus]